ncbi:zinc-finger homeodomain protein 5-like [Impatiens glandulifera]|uniref:zinc-finger homeodomain protein 5-like n=1 Tax=Impatiens glandulifera TaxID=253017 RepID=UPI001FB0C8D5|nr:zinc-finger homeodomain protein 5-like [Impatiens glandulifera]
MELAGGDDHNHNHHHQISRRSRGNSSSNNNNVAVYKECLRNHAASLGSYATDGCGEFTPEDMTNNNLQCAACGCHRNFHRKLVLLESQQQHVSESPSAAAAAEMSDRSGGSSGKKRVRTKFSEEQKEKMLELAEKVGWKMQRRNEINNNVDEIEQFCKEVGITRQVFKVWMHNHKNSNSNSSSSSATSSSVAATSLRICTANHPTADHQFI